MDHQQARRLLVLERRRTQQRMAELTEQGLADRTAANQPGDMFDSAEPLTEESGDDSVVVELERHMAAIERAEKRLDAGTYGFSVQSGLPIPDDRLAVDPTAELTVEEAQAG